MREAPVLALQGAPREAIQAALAAFVVRRRVEGWRVAGLIEIASGPEGPGCAGQALLDISTGARHPIGQYLGRHAAACHLDSAGVMAACQGVMNVLAEGCDVLVLAKFGKLEAARSGLTDAFARAIEAGVPVLTSVAPNFTPNWLAFSGSLGLFAPPDAAIIDDWWFGAAGPSPSGKPSASMHHGGPLPAY